MTAYDRPDLGETRDPAAEEQMLRIALTGHLDEFLKLPIESFDHWRTQEIARAIWRVHVAGKPIDLLTVSQNITSHVTGKQRITDVCNLLAVLGTSSLPAASAPYYAERLMALRAVRRLNTNIETYRGQFVWAAVNDDPATMRSASDVFKAEMEAAEAAFKPIAEIEPPMSLQDLLDEPEDEFDWLVPYLLERQDRLILTGFEGTGKSYLLAQFACCIAGGIHPFTGQPLPDQDLRTLVFDVENSKRQLRRRYRLIRAQVDTLRKRYEMDPLDWSQAVRFESRPEGVDLSDPKELARIEQALTATAPDLLVAGPLYKMSKLNIQEEQAAKELCDTLDALRINHGFTLITEAHAGHATDGVQRKVRPIGSSLFLRWPEFGYGLVAHEDAPPSEHPAIVTVKPWRGSRDERDWPSVLVHGTELPWQPTAGYYDMVRANGHG